MKTKRIKSLVLAMLMICSVLLMAACGGDKQPADSGKANYKVTIIGTDGQPCKSGVVVKFMKDGTQVAMQAVDAGGTATKELDKGDYTVELMFTDSEADYHYDKSALTLSANKTELQIDLTNAVSTESLLVEVPDGDDFRDCQVYYVPHGRTFVELDKDRITYFAFVPPVAGIYEFTVEGEVESLGYYGAPHYVSANNLVEMTGENKFQMSIYDDQAGEIGTVAGLIIGVKGKSDAKDAILSIMRIGAPEIDVAHQPWTVYKTTAALKPFKMPAGAVVKDFDVTAPTDTYKIVYNETDGYYHMNSENGPLILVRMGKNADRDDLVLPSFESVLELSPIVTFHYDENGNFLEKVDYGECLRDHIKNADEESGLYPLTKDLKYIIERRGEYIGWWNSDSDSYLFYDPNGTPMTVNTEIAWLFACCYISE